MRRVASSCFRLARIGTAASSRGGGRPSMATGAARDAWMWDAATSMRRWSSSAGADRDATDDGSAQKSLHALADDTDFPSMTRELLEFLDSDAEALAAVEEHVFGSQDAAEALSLLVSEWSSPDGVEEMVDKEFHQTLRQVDVEDGESMDEGEDELMQWAMKEFAEEFEDELNAEAEEAMEEASDEAEEEEAEEEELLEGKDDVEGDALIAKDYRALQNVMRRREEKELSEAGAFRQTALEEIFEITMDNPRPHTRGLYKRIWYPGNKLTSEELNPYIALEKEEASGRHGQRRIVKKFFRKGTCPFTEGKLKMPGHRDVGVLTRFVSERGKLAPRRRTGITAKNQRKLKRVVKRARAFGLLPYTSRLERPLQGM